MAMVIMNIILRMAKIGRFSLSSSLVLDFRIVNHQSVLDAAFSVAVDFTEVVLADSEAMELAALAVLTAVKVRIFMQRLLSALMKLLLAVRRLSACRAATVASRITKSIFRQVLNPVNQSDLKEKDIRESAEAKPVTCF